MSFAALVLAGGKSRRLGAPKALADLGGVSMTARVLAALRPGACALAINAPRGGEADFGGLGAALVSDAPDLEGRGPLAGVLSGMRWARALPDAPEGLVTAPCDMPFLPHDLGPRLARAASLTGARAAAALAGRRHFLCAYWSLSLIEPLESALRRTSNGLAAHLFLNEIRAADAVFPDDSAFANINTPEQLRAARGRSNGA